MQALKKGFTLIELIFVIVILGVLAAVVIPKMSATVDDAKIAKLASDIMTGCSDIAAYAVSQAETKNDLSSMSYAIKSLVDSGDAVLDIPNKKVSFKEGSVNDCVKVLIRSDENDENLSIDLGNAGGDKKCLQLQSIIDTADYPMRLRGLHVSYE